MMLWTRIVDFLLSVPPYAIIEPNERGIFLRGGLLKKTLLPGFYFKWPIYDNVYRLDITQQIINLPNQSITTKDGHALAASGAIEYSICDVEKALLCVRDFDESLQNLGLAIIAHYINRRSLAECQEIISIESEVYRGLKRRATQWGLEITKFWLTDLAEHKVYRLMTKDTPTVMVGE